jgi:hypothetical protein
MVMAIQSKPSASTSLWKAAVDACTHYQRTVNPLNIDPDRFLSALGTAQLPRLRHPVEL